MTARSGSRPSNRVSGQDAAAFSQNYLRQWLRSLPICVVNTVYTHLSSPSAPSLPCAGTYVDYSVERMLVSEFITKELVLFSVADNVRSIPSVLDGLKPAQRKVSRLRTNRLG